MGMTPKQSAFVAEYIATGNGTQSARAAGYSDSSDGNLNEQARDNLRNPALREAIAAAGGVAAVTGAAGAAGLGASAFGAG